MQATQQLAMINFNTHDKYWFYFFLKYFFLILLLNVFFFLVSSNIIVHMTIGYLLQALIFTLWNSPSQSVAHTTLFVFTTKGRKKKLENSIKQLKFYFLVFIHLLQLYSTIIILFFCFILDIYPLDIGFVNF